LAEQKLDDLLGPNGANLELPGTHSDVTLAQSASDNLIDVKLPLGAVVDSPHVTFGLGLPSLPFQAHGTVDFDAGLKMPDFECGLDKDAHFFMKPMTIQIRADANLLDANFAAELGFLKVQVLTNTDDPSHPTPASLSAGFDMNLTVDYSDPLNP